MEYMENGHGLRGSVRFLHSGIFQKFQLPPSGLYVHQMQAVSSSSSTHPADIPPSLSGRF